MKANQHAPRILAGQYRGRVIQVPTGRGTRPLRALARQSLFDMLAPLLPGARVLDLFAGAGTVGLEAASRGAARVVLVEQGRAALSALRRSIQTFGAEQSVRVVPVDVNHYLGGLGGLGGDEINRPPENPEQLFDFIFLGPPYRLFRDRQGIALEQALGRVGAFLAPEGTLVLEHPSNRETPSVAALTLVKYRTYGDTGMGFFEHPRHLSSQA